MSSIIQHEQSVHPGGLPANTAVPQASSRGGTWFREAAPTSVVIAALLGLAAWGHFSHWQVPKFSSLTGLGSATSEDWCAEHSVPESQCIECNQSLHPVIQDFGWCRSCGIAQCPLHHPEVAQLATTPAITDEDYERVRAALALRPRAENNSLCSLHQRRIQFASLQALQKAGVDIAVVGQRPVVEAVFANGEVVYDQTRAAQLASRVAGTVWRVERQLGDPVRKGEVLALIDSSAVGRAKEEFLQALAQWRVKEAAVERLRPLARDQAVPARQFREAEAALAEAQIRLQGAQQTLANLDLSVRAEEFGGAEMEVVARGIRSLGLHPSLNSSPADTLTTSNLFPLRSPLDGVVVSCQVVPGNVVDTNTSIFGVADVGRMWLTLNVRQDEVNLLKLGQPVLFRPSDSGDESVIKGSVAWISTAADDQTRTVQVRVNLPNEHGRLRAHTFGTGRIVLREEPRAIVVPSEAVHRDGDCDVVFVRDKDFFQEGAPKFFHIRKVRVGVKEGGQTEIIVGLLPGEVIASKNSVVLQSQLLRGNLGAGCCDHHH